MGGNPSVAARLARLAPDQRTAATAPPGPILCVAPAGSGKTTTLIARIAWLIDGGAEPGTITGITFNKRAAEELETRLGEALGPLDVVPGAVRIRTFHALGREILGDAGEAVEPLVDRDAVLRSVLPAASPAERRRLDTVISRLKLDLRVRVTDVAADPEAGPAALAFIAYEETVAATGGLDFDDLVLRALRLLESDAGLLARWRDRCAHLLVDEVQDVDRSQLGLALLVSAPKNRIFLVGDDDQSIYGWRLADVRRVLALASALPGLRRVDLVTNYRCPAPVVDRAVRLVAGNRERFAKTIRARDAASGTLVLAPDAAEEDDRVRRILRAWPADGETRAFLARTNRELLPALAVALELGIPFWAAGLVTPLEDSRLDALLQAIATYCRSRADDAGEPLLVCLGRFRAGLLQRSSASEDRAAAGSGSVEDPAAGFTVADLLAALLAWAAPYPNLDAFVAAVRGARDRLSSLRRDDALLTLATVHSTKGLEFDHVAVLGMEDGRFPSARSIEDAEDSVRALEEERRLAYVAWTRARRSLTLSYDPAAPSAFLLEAFEPDELGLPITGEGGHR